MITCIIIILIMYILYKMLKNEPIPYISNYIEGFKVSAWDGRGTNYKKCLNNIEGIRHYDYPQYANTCNNNDPFNKYL